MKTKPNESGMQEEYDFSQGVRGKYAKKYAQGTNVVVIEPDIAQYFPDHATVNEALRALLPIVKTQAKRRAEQPR